MCVTCGCSDTEGVTITDPTTGEKQTMSGALHDALHARGDAHRHNRLGEPGRPNQQASELVYRARPGGHGHQYGHGHDHPHDDEDKYSHDGDHHHDYDHHRHDHHYDYGHHHGTGHEHGHDHGRHHEHETTGHPTPNAPLHRRTLTLEENVLAKNQLLAERNRGWLAGRDILALNLVSSPGSGKTTLLERTIGDLNGTLAIHVIEGDQATENDALRIRATGCKVVQINTGAGCHLDADMLGRGLSALNPPIGAVVMIENVGNLVCPALFDLGERAKVVVLSVTEGEDKPRKYPHMFRAAEVMLVNKIDLLPYLEFDLERSLDYARQVNPALQVFCVSAQTGEGMDAWYGWLRDNAGSDRRGEPIESLSIER